ncbi:hypothetical protein CKAH01_18162 [Colletotrichum kahawae]|uniref:Uncharacterized protein n=1 Tax=Colletotrichum kahawae TaxID=34407 RepID=A0AAD9Y927_COLKA|nr:hypothetical protein CKAH01_18162 [Colletotrichum kahawae]
MRTAGVASGWFPGHRKKGARTVVGVWSEAEGGSSPRRSQLETPFRR